MATVEEERAEEEEEKDEEDEDEEDEDEEEEDNAAVDNKSEECCEYKCEREEEIVPALRSQPSEGGVTDEVEDGGCLF